MKNLIKFIFIFIFSVALNKNTTAQNMPFAFQAPLPTAHKYNDVQMIDANNAVAVGAMGAFIKSTDAGATWSYTWTKTHVNLFGVDFTDLNTGYAVGNSFSYSPYSVVKTMDGGQTWDTLNMGLGNDFYDVDFVSADTGWAVGIEGKIFYTSNGGNSWINQGITSTFTFNIIKMIDANIGYAAGANGLFYKTINGGLNWLNTGAGTNQNALAMFWRNQNEGWISFTSGIIKKTINGGQTWVNCSFTNGTYDVTSIHMKDSLNGIGATTQADIVRTSNGGQTWIGANNFGNQHIAVSFFGNQGVFVGYFACIQRSINGGTSILSVAGGYNYYNYNKIKFTDVNNGFCVGDGGKILKTSNGGLQWDILTPNVGSNLYDLDFINQNLGYLVGVNGTIKKTINGGTTFTNLTGVPSNTDLYSVSFVNATTGWVAGEGSAMYKTTNGGTSWVMQTLPSFISFVWQVGFVDANTGYATGGSNGNLFKTTDGGINWTTLGQNLLGLGSIKYFQFFSADTGYATTTQWKFLKTIDGGQTWNALANFCVGPPVMHFYNQNTGVISGDNTNFNCKMYKTIDGGLTWINTQVPFGPNVNGLFMTDTNSVYMCGDDGSIANFGTIGGVTTAIKNVNNMEVIIYPNPTSSILNIDLKNNIQNAQIEIINSHGQLILKEAISAKKTELNISHLSNGLYFLKIINANHIATQKLLKQ